MVQLFAFTDGACSGNPGPGGWGALLQAKDGDTVVKERELCGGEPETTWGHPEAQARAEELARAAAVVEVQAAGAKEFEVEVTWSEKVIEVDGRPLFVEGMAIAVAAGRPDLG